MLRGNRGLRYQATYRRVSNNRTLQLDRRIRVHAFLCVVGLLFYRWIQRRVEAVTKARIPIEALAGRLDRIQVVAMARPGSRKVRVVLQKLDREQTAVVKALGLERFVPN